MSIASPPLRRMVRKSREAPPIVAAKPKGPARTLPATRQLIAHLLPTADRSVFVEATRQLIAPFSVGCACFCRVIDLLLLLCPARVTSVGNRQRPHHGGPHARRICGTSTCHHAPSQRPTCRVHLSGPGPLPVLVPQVVAPLPRVGGRGPVRPDPRHPPHRARTGESYPLDPPPAAGPRLADDPLLPHRSPGHLGRTQGPQHPPASQSAHHRARAPAQRLDRAAGPSRPASATPGVPWPAGPSLQPTPRGRPRRASLPQGQRPPLLHLGGQGRLRRGCLPAPGRFAPYGRGPLVSRGVLEGPGTAGAGPARQGPRVGRLGAGSADPVAGDPALPAVRRQPGVHPGGGAAVQWQRGGLQRLVPASAVRPPLPSAWGLEEGAG